MHDYVIKRGYYSSSTRPKWYRLYKSGWIEQFGRFNDKSVAGQGTFHRADFTFFMLHPSAIIPGISLGSVYSIEKGIINNSANAAHLAAYGSGAHTDSESTGETFYCGDGMDAVCWRVLGKMVKVS